MHLHGADSFGGDASKRAAPTGVNGSDRAFFGIDEENGNAVGGLDGEEKTGAIRDGGVTAAWRGPL